MNRYILRDLSTSFIPVQIPPEVFWTTREAEPTGNYNMCDSCHEIYHYNDLTSCDNCCFVECVECTTYLKFSSTKNFLTHIKTFQEYKSKNIVPRQRIVFEDEERELRYCSECWFLDQIHKVDPSN